MFRKLDTLSLQTQIQSEFSKSGANDVWQGVCTDYSCTPYKVIRASDAIKTINKAPADLNNLCDSCLSEVITINHISHCNSRSTTLLKGRKKNTCVFFFLWNAAQCVRVCVLMSTLFGRIQLSGQLFNPIQGSEGIWYLVSVRSWDYS